ncbi:MAG: YraN family protein, partial [Candidatus Latescibacteria bacterium]|nr:YraN family protein [Candidatus Latescibacterota bacterium]
MPGSSDRRVVTGRHGEEFSVAFLTQLGYTIVERNWRAGATGEIDIVAMDGSTQVF